MTKIAYFVHNLADAAVARRIVMLRAGGAEVIVAGFCRDEIAPTQVAGARAISLGRTHDADLGQRARMVLRNLAAPTRLAAVANGADVVMARNLEMLVLAARAAKLGKVGRLVYESLDIHRSLLGSGLASKALRWIERRLMRQSALLIYSSPAFLRHYFAPMQALAIPARLVENKLLDLDNTLPPPISPPAPPPYTIGWFGNLRCKRTLAILRQLADIGQGRIRILICGKPSGAEFPDFPAQVAHPQIRYLGPYTAADLPGLYAQCHFAWAIDFFEEGLNSTWLLPNRLYESAAFGTVPIALNSVETGHWLAAHGAGLLLTGRDVAAQVMARLDALDVDGYADLRAAMDEIPKADLICRANECRDLVVNLAGAE
jgi:glycosyltransferase involved in cell wall biosynthesis